MGKELETSECSSQHIYIMDYVVAIKKTVLEP